MRSRCWLIFGLALSLACDLRDDIGGGETSGNPDTGEACEPDVVDLDPLVAECSPLATDYRPTASTTGNWPSCITDDGQYHLFGNSPGTIARIEAYEEIRSILLTTSAPTRDDFTRARVAYAQDEGLESRVVRREDLHHPEIPMSDWEPGVDPDKQCTIESNVMKYPDRCIGPARMAPLLNETFRSGQMGEGNARVLAEQIDAALLWFIHLSVHKEAFTCATSKGADCDSAWAYYNGGTNRQGGLGMAAQVRALDPRAHDAIWDGILAARCWRDAYSEDDYPTLNDAPRKAQDLFLQGWEQLDNALWHGYALIIRDRLERQLNVCGDEAEANLAWLSITGPVLAFEAHNRDANQASTLEAAWSTGMPSREQVEAAVDALDALFPCPEAG